MILPAVWQDVLVGGLGYAAGLSLGFAFYRGEVGQRRMAAPALQDRLVRGKRATRFRELLADRVAQALAVAMLFAMLLALGLGAYYLAGG